MAKQLTDVLTDGVTEVTKEGEVVKVTAPAAYFACAIKLLKDNKIEVEPGHAKKNPALQGLKAAVLPFPLPGEDMDDVANG